MKSNASEVRNDERCATGSYVVRRHLQQNVPVAGAASYWLPGRLPGLCGGKLLLPDTIGTVNPCMLGYPGQVSTWLRPSTCTNGPFSTLFVLLPQFSIVPRPRTSSLTSPLPPARPFHMLFWRRIVGFDVVATSSGPSLLNASMRTPSPARLLHICRVYLLVDEWQTEPRAAQRVLMSNMSSVVFSSVHPFLLQTRPLTSPPPQGWLVATVPLPHPHARDDVATSPDLDTGARSLGSQPRQWSIFIRSRPRPTEPTGFDMPVASCLISDCIIPSHTIDGILRIPSCSHREVATADFDPTTWSPAVPDVTLHIFLPAACPSPRLGHTDKFLRPNNHPGLFVFARGPNQRRCGDFDATHFFFFCISALLGC